jgi:hypothetical protein
MVDHDCAWDLAGQSVIPEPVQLLVRSDDRYVPSELNEVLRQLGHSNHAAAAHGREVRGDDQDTWAATEVASQVRQASVR